MKNKFSILIGVAALVLAAGNVLAQNYHPYALTTVASNLVVTNGATSNLNAVVDCSGSQIMAIYINPGGQGASTNELLSISASVDNLTYDTNHWVIYGLTGGTPVVTNITVGGFQSIRFDSLVNTNAASTTNTIKAAEKLSSP